ncbi:MAG TPA: NFACT RNA binding domain-containing protein, partial [Candidatus Melainabacteria bacterium]|nr:NFACT RNA binding domain-containing protein [Candidatus Melainabacteria bacterium]
SANDLIENYFRLLEAKELYLQLKEKIKSEINTESSKLEERKSTAQSHLSPNRELETLKDFGDMILSNLNSITAGQSLLELDNWNTDNNTDNGGIVKIELNPNLTAVQNAQVYYRRYAKARARKGAAQSTISEVDKRLSILNDLRSKADKAPDMNELQRIKDTLAGRRQHSQPKSQKVQKIKGKARMTSLISSDGWTIYVGRNKNENDHLIGKIANPNDLWFHVLGKGGAHVLIRVPASKQDPPKTTIEEAAQVAARLSKSAAGAKVRVIYTRCKHVKKVDKNKPGLVRYENERTIEVDTAKPMPKLMKRLFN